MNRDVRKLVSSLERIDGVEVTTGGSGHLIVSKDGHFVVSLSATPSDVRWKDNALAQLRRAGITPGVRPPKKKTGPPKVKQMDVRAELQPIKEARLLPEFARFTQQLGEIRGLRTFASVNSAENSIRNVANNTMGLRSWGWELVMAALIEWRRRKPIEMLPQTAPRGGVEIEAPPVEPQEQTGVKLVIDLDRLAAKLAEFGIDVEVR